ncbi:NUDIX hydrolase [Candidatus Berkelbacteria bacterium]|nr:NUDIX hydrolase [Candidatus Berkelbacteria bacterium]
MKTPKNAKLIAGGERFQIWSWSHAFDDGTKGTYERVKRRPTVEVVALQKDRVVVIRETQPYKGSFLSFPGGTLDWKEDALHGAKRELLEETGMTSSNWEKLTTLNPWNSLDWDLHVFIARGCTSTNRQNLDPGEDIKFELFDYDDFRESVFDKTRREGPFLTSLLRIMHDDKKAKDFQRFLFEGKEPHWLREYLPLD